MKIKNIQFLIALIVIITISGCTSKKIMVDNNTVKKLDIDSFLGKWYEIARFPHSFEKDLVGVTATYTKLENGKIEVLNQGYKHSLEGKHKKAIGKAYIPDLQDPAKLRVSFFWIFYSDYLIMELDDVDYQWALIGSSSPNYLWILSRTPIMDEQVLMDLKSKIGSRGYDLEKLMFVTQK